jgi:L-serine dehydratase
LMKGNMKSLRELYRIGLGPSSSHTMGPANAVKIFRGRTFDASKYRVILYGSLAKTGKGHLTDHAINNTISPVECEIIWEKEKELPLHPNGMKFEAYNSNGQILDKWTVYSIGGGALMDEHKGCESDNIYPFNTMQELLEMCEMEGKSFWNYVEDYEPGIWDYLREILYVMKKSIDRGIDTEGVLPGGLKLRRKASQYYTRATQSKIFLEKAGTIFAYALAVAEENASGNLIVTAPTSGSAGVIPSVLYSIKDFYRVSDEKLIKALATAGIIGNIIKSTASISGAEVGCQGEIGTACAMAAGAAAQLMGGTPHQIEYAAEMGMEHHLGLTCDPIMGLVQIPCIERNAIAAVRAIDCASYALLSDGRHMVSFDEVVDTMAKTGKDMKTRYRETSEGGLAVCYNTKNKITSDKGETRTI